MRGYVRGTLGREKSSLWYINRERLGTTVVHKSDYNGWIRKHTHAKIQYIGGVKCLCLGL